MAAELRAWGVTHLLFSIGDAGFVLLHDPTGDHLVAAEFFLTEFQSACTEKVYGDDMVSVFELDCLEE